MEQEIHITLRFNLATGKVGLNEIIYKLKELQDPLMLNILEEVLRGYDDLISERLSRTDIYPSKARKGLGRHAFGFLNQLISFSIAKLERHISLCEETGPERAPTCDPEPYDVEGLEVIKRNGSKANYMRDDHTLKNTGRTFLY